jgi:hypothetical protein
MTTPANTSGTAKKLSEFFKSLDTRIRVPLVNAFASNKGEPDLTRRLEGASSIGEIESIQQDWTRNKGRFPH